MSTFFTNTDETNCHVSTEPTFLLVDSDDNSQSFSHNLVSIVNPTSVLATATLRLN